MAPKRRPKLKLVTEEVTEEEPVAAEPVTGTVEIEELPGGGTRETFRPSRRYSS